MKEYEIWSEGWMTTGADAPAWKVGTSIGNNFDAAVEDFISKHNSPHIERNVPEGYSNEEAYTKRRSNWNIWGCDLFDNEAEARRAFG